ncbi:MAG: phenylalanine--tRNA ligase subunit alpha [Candidatus Thermoplasmatota archaeon]|nr:phenylalanine--tRNA ligase subunit alpha [Euryarchaeota archaeon]MBU4032642.1 phenylalanine--tRNA ligase subunit alpha [Candidatus Thermoplasmatota archaeon]MBU4070743.1 phenylalanine--tRNA ligase subunit alpha [Candidatus Thermoplasmatota archaeon]MBU4145161.1 phenylalanine--tRNA ligase subunit alpha [Candidatus Thermoplasmatota archaeon]MBU4592180.1 phenylalanine--tRNA ligase subunit alpha [Candidatus Thermoplasmatota archaeon]
MGKILGDTVPSVVSSLKAIMASEDRIFVSQVEVMNACSWLRAKSLVEMSEKLEKHYSLLSKRAGEMDLPERRALKALKKAHGSMSVDELRKDKNLKSEEVPIAMGWLKRKGWVSIEKKANETVLELTQDGKNMLSKKGLDEELIERLAGGELHESEVNEHTIDSIIKRQDIVRIREEVVRTVIIGQEGIDLVNAGLDISEEITNLTPELIQTGKWRGGNIRRYDIETFAPNLSGGKSHPLQQYIEKVRGIFLNMGFMEIDYGFVQSAFWNMDALFTAQDHPAREMHDTLYLKRPGSMELPDSRLVNPVKRMHEQGDGESDGWQYAWQETEARKALLRTHTTVNTIRYLAEHPEPPVKVFSVGPVFRKEAVDPTHLPEFIQVEGIVMEEGANLTMLVGLLKEFYGRMGVEDMRIRPGYFPYTEPSVEPEIFHNGNWMELGGAGIFRPEVTRPFGIKHPVLAWGLGLERLVMTVLGMDDIRKLYVSDIDWLRESPIIE